jgi:hypothetical protein
MTMLYDGLLWPCVMQELASQAFELPGRLFMRYLLTKCHG